MQKHNFVLRTIKDGHVRIGGMIMRPSNQWQQYDGRLDGMRYAFGLYWTTDKLQPFAYLWGPEEHYRNIDETFDESDDPQLVDGIYPWATWATEEEHERMDILWRRIHGQGDGA